MQRYNPKDIEPKWQKYWDETGTYTTDLASDKPKYMAMSMFNYPSGILHIGHAMNYTISDVKARFKRQQGYESYHPVGWDAFGLPAENRAIKVGVGPQESMAELIPLYHKMYKAMGWSNDWEKEIATHLPEYYKWTQWIFSEMYRHNLVYQDARMQWWCSIDNTVLANEQVIDGKCWRHDAPDDPLVEKREVKQWFFKITDYADELLSAIDDLDWTESVKLAQKNWIGKSVGAEIDFKLQDSDRKITVFTTRPDTLFGATFMVVAPDSELAQTLITEDQRAAADAYIREASKKTEVERQASKEKTGVFSGSYAINPVTDKPIPVWLADYVLAGYGTGAIMAVPAHDERDWEFAKKFNLAIQPVVAPEFIDAITPPRQGEPFVERVAVQAIVKHPTDDTYLMLRLKGWQTEVYGYPTGGIDDGESVEETACRELAEETGLHNVADITQVGEPYFARFYHEYKQVNRRVKMHTVAVTLRDLDRLPVEQAEQNIHELHWMSADEVLRKLHGEGCRRMFEIYRDGGGVLTGEGVMVNSGVYDGLPSNQAREKIIADLAKKGDGHEKVNYRMRDWSVSRQRYWGAPIPIIHCSECQSNIKQTAHELHFRQPHIWEKVVTGRKTMETRADNPEEPERRFADIKAGDYLRLVNMQTNEERYAVVKQAMHFADLAELYEDKLALTAVCGGVMPGSLEEFTAGYGSLASGYADKIAKNGLIGWEFALMEPGVHLVPDEQLPVLLPELDDFKPSGDGRSALARAKDWLEVACPQCGGPAERETDTLDTYIDSSWYMYRYMDPHNQHAIFNSDIVKKWEPIDFYNGADHATAHLLYARFIARFFTKLGLVNEPEPFKHFLFNGKVTAADGQMFSKSKGNGIDPLEIINSGYGADALRTYLMFAAPLDLWARWDPQGVPGTHRFLSRLWTLVGEYNATEPLAELSETHQANLRRITHETIKKVTEDIEADHYNTAIAATMQCVNELYKLKTKEFGKHEVWQRTLEAVVACVAPFAPHIAEELWHQLGHSTTVHKDTWPAFETKYLVQDTKTVAVQVNGKLRGEVTVPASADEKTVVTTAQTNDKVKAYLADKSIRKTIYVPDKLVNFVV